MSEKQSNKKLFLGVSFGIAIISIMVFSAIGTSLLGVELHGIEKEISKIEQENRDLNAKLINSTSLTKLYDNSLELGFSNPKQIVYADNNNQVAQILQ